MNDEPRKALLKPRPQRFSMPEIGRALSDGWRTFRAIPKASISYSVVFVLIGSTLLAGLGWFGFSPMALPFAGGFLLVGPALLTGFFKLSRKYHEGKPVSQFAALGAFVRAPAGIWVVSVVCAFLFLVWITDAAVLYSFMVGTRHLPYRLPWLIDIQQNVIGFEILSSIMGSVLAFIIFAVSAFSVPLLYDGRATLVEAVSSSVRAVFQNIVGGLVWGVLLSASIIVSVIVLPLLLLTLPVLAYASLALYQEVFPICEKGQRDER
jgi:uncharacterized membrane protein